MDAVNLIPVDARKRGTSVSASPLTLGLIGGLVVILAAAVLYVSALNDVRSNKSELAQVNASVSSWQAAANSFSRFEQTAQERGAQLASVRQLANGRFPWSQLLSQIGGVMPAKAALSSLQATVPSTSAPTTTVPGATAAPTGSSVALTGCAQDESTVARTMEQLRRVSGVSSVSLSSAAEGGSGTGNTAAATTGASSGGGGCPFAVQFTMSLTLAQNAAGASTSSTAATTSATTAGTTAATTATTPQAGASSQ